MIDRVKEKIEKHKEYLESLNPLNQEIHQTSNSVYESSNIGLENMFLLGQASIINMLNDFFKEHNTISKDYFNDITYGVDEKLKEYIKKLGKE